MQADLYHIPSNDLDLDLRADITTLSAIEPKSWQFNGIIPQKLYRGNREGLYYLTNPVAIEMCIYPFPIETVDALEYTLHIINGNKELHEIYNRKLRYNQ